MSTTKPLVSIITINYNHSDVTCALLKSLRRISYKNIEVIVIDNASPNDTPDKIAEEYPEIHLIKSEVNLGFAGGNNLGIEAAKGEFLFFVNNDVEVVPNFMEPLLAAFEEDDQIGMVSPKIRYHHTPNTIQYAGATRINPYTVKGAFLGHGEVDEGQHDEAHITHYGHGAGMMVKKEVVAAVGMMPEIYFLYYEELDWCEQIKAAGYKIFVIPDSLIYHKESISVGKFNPMKTYYLTRNRLVYMRRNVKGKVFMLSMLYFFFMAVPKNTLLFLFKFDFKLLSAYYRGIFWNCMHLNVSQNSITHK